MKDYFIWINTSSNTNTVFTGYYIHNYRANFHAFHAKLISDSFKAIEAFSENKDIAASVIRKN
jgi:hypothetical protein